MKATINRADLLNALESVRGGVADKPFEPILTHVLFDEGGALGWNGDVGVRVRLPFKLEGKFNVNFALLFNLVRALDEQDVEFTVEGKRVTVRCGRHRSTLQQMEQEFPKPTVNVKAEDWRVVPAGFAEALERVRQTVSKDSGSAGTINFDCVYIEGDYLYSSDRKRMTRCRIEGMGAPAFLLPPKAAAELARMGNPRRLAFSGALAAFDFGNLMFIARTRDGVAGWPVGVCDNVLESRAASEPLPDGLANALTRLLIFAGESGAVVADPTGLGLNLTATAATSDAEEILAPAAAPFEKKMFAADELKAALPYADAIDWGQRAGDPVYLSGDTAGFEFVLTPMFITSAK